MSGIKKRLRGNFGKEIKTTRTARVEVRVGCVSRTGSFDVLAGSGKKTL